MWPAKSTGASHLGLAPADGSGKSDFEVSIGAAPDQRDARQPILSIDGLPRMRVLFGGKDARRGGELRPGNFPANRALRHGDARIVADALGLAHVAAGHDIKLAGVFAKPDWRGDFGAVLAKSSQRNVLLPANGGWHGWLRGRHACSWIWPVRLAGMVRV